ncbi:ribosome maturation protein SDO1 [Sporothrix brasiliensis 5110]|uniref:Ribosome maturation protein SDO1 n=1 Tax=Sporothrix brasiliensis 5110 TaxID=1398154 RepID=A0A0C2J7F9_9PEZI|nr:ribosome maturation protein SDO1 [Sporothrix brasiliensis 5110]KIH92952.1 ribosome maturation protein SDO1 [Sporothrix brasiliensis 5110]
MSRQINQPSNQIKLTNVSLVRLKKGKKRFEIACYKNKVLEWRSGIETDLDNVLQIPNVFINVSKGQTAPAAELTKAFGSKATTESVVLEILKKGELQVGDKERAAQLDRVHHEVIDIVAGKLVDPRTRRVYTTGMIEKALDMLSAQAHQQQEQRHKEQKEQKQLEQKQKQEAEDDQEDSEGKKPVSDEEEVAGGKDGAAAGPAKVPMWTGVTATKSAKSQALDAMKALIALQPIPVMRARMRLRVTCTTSVLKQAVKTSAPATSASGEEGGQKKAPGTVKDKILSYVEQVESQDVVGSSWEVTGFVEPGAFKALSDFVDNETRGQGRVEVLDVTVTKED